MPAAAIADEDEQRRLVPNAVAPPVSRVAFCDLGSKLMFTAIGEAVIDVQEELEVEEIDVNRFFKEKLDYWDTDICHYANATMREVQFCESLTKLPTAASAHTRATWTAEETTYALHLWHRQLRLHHALAQETKEPRKHDQKSKASTLKCSVPEQNAGYLLREPKFKRQADRSKLRDWLRNTMNRDGLVEAVGFLQENGIVEANGFNEARSKPKKTFTVKKRPWQDVSQNTDALELLKRLCVSRDCFE